MRKAQVDSEAERFGAILCSGRSSMYTMKAEARKLHYYFRFQLCRVSQKRMFGDCGAGFCRPDALPVCRPVSVAKAQKESC